MCIKYNYPANLHGGGALHESPQSHTVHDVMRYYAVRARPASSPVEPIGSIQTTPFRPKPYGKPIWCYSSHRLGLKPYSKSGWCYPNNSFQTQTIEQALRHTANPVAAANRGGWHTAPISN